MATAAAPRRAAIVWFRKGLRLHDNGALLEACSPGIDHVYPIFILDPHFLTQSSYKVGVNRYNFLLESLSDLDGRLRAVGSRLLVLRGQPATLLPRLFNYWGVTKVCYEVDTEPYAKARDADVAAAAAAAGVSVHAVVGHTLYDTAMLVARNNGAAPLTMQSFTKLVDRVGPPPAPRPAPTRVPPPAPGAPGTEPEATGVPTWQEVGFKEPPTTIFKGGETEALARLERCMADAKWVAAFEKPSTDPTALEPPATTVLSPYLKFGCLSSRLFHQRLLEIYAAHKGHSQPPVSLRGQLLWREHFYTVGAVTPNFNRMVGNPICKQIQWQDNEEYLAAWRDARTGFPWIDAIMTQLRQWGWIHHLARHSVACFLTRGDLYVSWERGQEVFEELLLDQDHHLNAANWMWLSASAFFAQYFRVYSPIAFGKKYDPEGKYIRKFLPVLAKMPAKYIYEPWTAPASVQQAAGCIIGKDYPKPIVDHAVASKACMARMKAAYHAAKGIGTEGGSTGGEDGADGTGDDGVATKAAGKGKKKAAASDGTAAAQPGGAKRQKTLSEAFAAGSKKRKEDGLS